MPFSTPPLPNPDPDRPPKLLTDYDLADIVGVTVKTVRNWRTRQQGPDYTCLTPGCVRYTPAAVQAFIESRMRKPGGRPRPRKRARR